jgi:hypothetical protein
MAEQTQTGTDYLATAAYVGSRRIRLRVYPIDEKTKWVARGDHALEIVSDGSRDTLAMTCIVEKSIQGIPNSSTVRIWNLSEDSKTALSLKGLQSEIAFCDPYSNKYQTVYVGSIMSCVSDRSGADIITTLYLLMGVVMLKCTPAQYSYSNTAISFVLDDVRKKLNLEKIRIYGLEGRTVKRFSYMGPLDNMLNKLAFQEAFSWGIDGNELVVVEDGKSTGNVLEITPETGLIKAAPMLTGAFYDQNGVSITSYPCAWISPGDNIKVKSTINAASCNRDDLRIATMKYNLSTIDDQWTMDLTCYTEATIGV